VNHVNFWVNGIADAIGNSYSVIEAGSQVWMAENLRTTRYNDETEIPPVTDNSAWSLLTEPGYCWFNNDQNTYGEIYGALYNWYAVDPASNGEKNICPVGWRVPTDSEWGSLASFLDPTLSSSGGMLKEAGTQHWSATTTNTTNKSGFTGLPGGFRNNLGQFSQNGNYGFWWTSSLFQEGYASLRTLDYETTGVGSAGLLIVYGNSFRCIKLDAAPIVSTAKVSSITSNSALCGGYISPDQGVDFAN
jgi:uncharacterized protein (TIGR02145 family)